ncbi:MAG: acyl carrier protein [Verrucomicrobiae bacterium]|nr:acyl carrier protein [Verrucomicrobiae bacterium]
MHSSEDIRRHVLARISSHSGMAADKIDDASDFIAEGLLDSFGALTMIVSLEATFGVRFDPIELADESARTVGGLVNLVAQKQQEQQ